MYYIFFIIFIGNLVKGETDSEEAKHIDSLPEKERGQFLENISRRIFNDVQTKDARQRSSGEMSDDHLDEHDDFVHKILKEESSNMRKSNAKELKEEERKSQENMEVKALERDKIIHEDVRHIDLTLREGKEISKKRYSGDIVRIKDHIEDVDNNTEAVKLFKIVKEGSTSKNINEDFMKSDTDDIQVVNFRRNIPEDGSYKQKSKEIATTMDSDVPKKTVMVDFNPETPKSSVEEFITTKDIKLEKNITAFELEESTTNLSEITTVASENIKEVKSKEDTWSGTSNTDLKSYINHSITDTLEDTTKMFSADDLTTTDKESETDSSKQITKIETEAHEEKTYRYLRSIKEDSGLYTDEINKLTDSSTVASTYLTQEILFTNMDIRDAATPSIVPVTPSSVGGGNLTNIEIILGVDLENISVVNNTSIHYKPYTGNNKVQNTNRSSLVEAYIYHNVSYLDNNTIENKLTKKNENSVKSDEVSNELVKMLRHSLLLHNNNKNLNESNFSDLKTLNKKEKAKGHVVFEMPQDEPSFVRKMEDNTKEPPYYVPVYNYSPNSAYYRAHNRLGPNADDPSSERIIIHSHDPMSDDGKDIVDVDNILRERKFRFRNKDSKYSKAASNTRYKLHMPVVIRNPTFKLYNPDDYIDMDLYYDRQNFRHPVERTRCKSDSEGQEYQKNIEDKEPIIFPNSHEEDHPSRPHNNLQGHMRAIRKILYQNKHFGYIAPPSYTGDSDYIGKSPYLRSKQGDIVFKTKSKRPEDKNIASDYYFSRMSIKSPNDVQKDYIKHSNGVKYINFRNIPEDIIRYIKKIYKGNSKEDEESTRFVNHLIKNKREYLKALKRAQTDSLLKSASEENPSYVNELIKAIQHSNSAASLPNKKSIKRVDYDLIETVINSSDAKNLMINLDKLLATNSTVTNNVWQYNFDVYATILKDMIKMDSAALKQYDWLGTTVDIQAALSKLLALTESLLIKEKVHPLDLQLLKYFILLHKSSKNIVEKFEIGTLEDKLRSIRKKELLPRNKRKKNKKYLKEKGLLNRVWLYRKGNEKDMPYKNTAKEDIVHFYEFLSELQFYLYDLHDAIKGIAMVTDYNHQKWFNDLKRIYLTSNKGELLQIILHLTTTRLLGLIEESAKNGAEESYYTYIKGNTKNVIKTREEFVFVLRLLNQLKIVDDDS